MILLEKSWHSRLYRLIYGRYNSLPSNLCPYFWKVMVGAILFIPFTIICSPILLFEKIIKDDDPMIKDGYLDGPILLVSIMVDFILAVLICMVLIWLIRKPLIDVLGVLGYVTLLSIGIVQSLGIIKNRKKVEKEKTPNIFVEFIKAKYNRYCPKIDWKK